ncbi:MAG: molybdopterin-dependent oxidoreductase [Acidimicrobiia bacterium]|nr:molybdopterin-dependent oxidoreductase [Acidimicrobiia bacterium]
MTITNAPAPSEAATDDEPTGDPNWWGRALSGAMGAAAALTFAELIDGISDKVPSLVIAVAEVMVDYAPGDVAAQSIETLGTAQKTITLWGIVIVSLAIGAFLGYKARRSLRPVVIGFVGFAVVGGWAAARSPLSSAGWSWVTAFLAAAVGIGVTALFLWILRREPTTGRTTTLEDPRQPHRNRRTFLAWVGAGAVGTAVVARWARHLETSSDASAAREALTLPGTGAEADTAVANLDTLDEVPGITTYVTPNDDFYLIDTAFTKPQVNPDSWRLSINGMVDNPYEITFDQLQVMEAIDVPITLSCVSNEVGGNLVGNAIWTGVPLLDVLEEAGIQDGAEQVFARSVDDFTAGFPLELLRDGRQALVAYGMNGEPLPIQHGFPVRLVVAGIYGYVSAVKWVEEISLTPWEGVDGFWIPRGWSKEGPIKTQSRIDTPRNNESVAPGPVAIGGVAWAPNRGIGKVEVRINAGDWEEANLGEGLSDDTWRQWTFAFDAEPGEQYAVQCRATDGDGEVQPDSIAPPRPDGAEGHHTILVSANEA